MGDYSTGGIGIGFRLVRCQWERWCCIISSFAIGHRLWRLQPPGENLEGGVVVAGNLRITIFETVVNL